MTPRPEAVAAATWWAEQLATPPQHDAGAPPSTAFANAATDHSRQQRTPEQIDAFRTALADRIEQHLAHYCWLPNEPDFGSYVRALVVDPVPDDVLTDAAERAGFRLTSFDLPMRTVMWIDPGIVKVAAGHGAGSVVIWAAPTTATTGRMTS
ncbi:hypothetical protein AB0M41_40120 [Streptomyces sp. NPDC051896]|uniref:hypothetical protein n=1 Tax=Streptomyces sp. NPDC051896 TaxID=3155416 RepID=UPI0034281FC6